MNVYSRPYGITRNGDKATLYTLMGESGMTVEITDFGGTLTSIKTPDRTGKLAEVILGYDSLADYEQADGYLGALVGRVANRIGGSSFDLGGVHYELYANDGRHHLHGGRVGYNAVLWNATPAVTDTAASLILTYRSPELLKQPWYVDVDMSKYLSLIIATLNHDRSLSTLLNPLDRINRLMDRYGFKRPQEG